MTITSYSLATGGLLPLQRRERHEGGRAGGLGSGFGALERLLGIETIDARPQLAVLVAKLPVGFSQPLESFGKTPRLGEGNQRHREGYSREQPLEHQQNSYLIERLATVSTA